LTLAEKSSGWLHGFAGMSVALFGHQLEPEGVDMKNLKLTIASGLLAGALTVPGVTALADDDGREHSHKHRHFHIPPGHLPPAGKCRIWFPDRPPGHQPPAGDCWTLSRQVPRGAFLIGGGERRWSHDDVRYHHSRGEVFDARGYFRRQEIRNDIKDVRQSRQELREDREQLQKNLNELKRDRAELRRDIRDGASRKEIKQDRREIREDRQKIADSRQEVRQSQQKLEGARQELREDLRRR
jgi:hypothetical protein